jgi:hypothetical protein
MALLAYPSNPLHLVRNHILLLRSNDHSRPHDPHECNDFLSGKGVFVDKVGWASARQVIGHDELTSDQDTCPAKSGFAVYSHPLALPLDNIL